MPTHAQRPHWVLAVSFGAFAALLALVIPWLNPRERTPAPETMPSNLAPTQEADVGVPARTQPLAPVAADTEESSRTAITDGAASGGAEDEAVLALAGSFVEVSNGALTRLSFDGSVYVHVRSQRWIRDVRIPVTAGRFELHLVQIEGHYRTRDGKADFGPDSSDISFQIAVPGPAPLDGHVHFDLENTRVLAKTARIPFGTRDAEVIVRKAATIELAVLDQETGLPLDAIDVLLNKNATPRWLDTDSWRFEVLMEDVSSPVRLTPTGVQATSTEALLLVRAQGYASTAVPVNFVTPSRRQVELVRAGGLSVRLEGSWPPDAVLRLRDGIWMLSERAAAGTAVTFDHLAPGDYDVSVELGAWQGKPARLGASTVHVESGRQTDLTLAVEPLGPVVSATVSGVLHLPPEWSIPEPSLDVRMLSASKTGTSARIHVAGNDLKAIAERAGHYRFELSDLEVGSYSIILAEPTIVVSFELPPGGATDVRIDVPPPVEFTVVLKDSVTGADVPDVRMVTWHPVTPDGRLSGGGHRVMRDNKTGRFPLRVPAGEIGVVAFTAIHSGGPLKLVPIPGEVVTIHLTAR